MNYYIVVADTEPSNPELPLDHGIPTARMAAADIVVVYRASSPCPAIIKDRFGNAVDVLNRLGNEAAMLR